MSTLFFFYAMFANDIYIYDDVGSIMHVLCYICLKKAKNNYMHMSAYVHVYVCMYAYICV